MQKRDLNRLLQKTWTRTLDPDPGPWTRTLDPGPWTRTLDAGSRPWTLDPGPGP